VRYNGRILCARVASALVGVDLDHPFPTPDDGNRCTLRNIAHFQCTPDNEMSNVLYIPVRSWYICIREL
jgi:hypothetical protein